MGNTPPVCCFLKYLLGQNSPILSSLAFFSKWNWGSSDGWFKKSWPVNRPFLGFCCISASILPKTTRIHHNINLWVEGSLPEKIYLLPVSLSCTTPLFRVLHELISNSSGTVYQKPGGKPPTCPISWTGVPLQTSRFSVFRDICGDCSDNMKMGDGWRYCSGWWHLSCEKDSEGHDFENCTCHGSGSKRLRLTPPMILPTFSPPKALQSQTLSLHPCPTLTSTKTVLHWKNRPKDPPSFLFAAQRHSQSSISWPMPSPHCLNSHRSWSA